MWMELWRGWAKPAPISRTWGRKPAPNSPGKHAKADTVLMGGANTVDTHYLKDPAAVHKECRKVIAAGI